MACTIAVRHAGYELDFMLPRILSYFHPHGPEGARASFTIQHVKEHPASGGGHSEDSGASIPCPAHLNLLSYRSSCIITKKISLLPLVPALRSLSAVVELQGLEPWTPALQRQCSSQLSYSPQTFKFQSSNLKFQTFGICILPNFKPPVGLAGVEPATSRLSGVRSNHLSYKPMLWLVARGFKPVEQRDHPDTLSGALTT